MSFVLDNNFEWFLKRFGDPQNPRPVSNEVLENYKDHLPNRLLEYWKEYGFCRFNDGLFWLVNPDDYKDVMGDWLEGSGITELDNFHVFARTGFGSLFLWGEKTGDSWRIDIRNSQLFYRKSKEKDVAKNPDDPLRIFFGAIGTSYADLKDVNSRKYIFESAVSKFGPLEEDEMFTFIPALFLGGEQTLKKVSKVNLYIQSEILAGMGQRELMDIKGLSNMAFGK